MCPLCCKIFFKFQIYPQLYVSLTSSLKASAAKPSIFLAWIIYLIIPLSAILIKRSATLMQAFLKVPSLHLATQTASCGTGQAWRGENRKNFTHVKPGICRGDALSSLLLPSHERVQWVFGVPFSQPHSSWKKDTARHHMRRPRDVLSQRAHLCVQPVNHESSCLLSPFNPNSDKTGTF